MIKRRVNVGAGYDILTGDGLLSSDNGAIALAIPQAVKVLVVTDDVVASLYLYRVKLTLQSAGLAVFVCVIPHGEQSKNINEYQRILSAAAEAALNRRDAIVALGGGVVGDLAGFAAATYMRGIRVVQLPTTFLAGIDAAIGGKTGIDTAFGKNTVGCFWQPSIVCFDTQTLQTLPQCEWQNGLAEGVKCAILCGGETADIVQRGVDANNVARFAALCQDYKAGVVEEDEREGGKRALLNLGHTVGHAVERLSSYTVAHGLAVAKGLAAAIKVSVGLGVLDAKVATEMNEIVESHFDTRLGYSAAEIASAAVGDKKTYADGIHFIAIYGWGDCRSVVLSVDKLEGLLK